MTTHNGAGEGDPHHELLLANQAYAEAFADQEASKLPRRQLFVLACMDARIDPLRLLGLRPGDAHVVRNAGGRVTDDVIRSLVISSTLLGTRHAVVLHHTDCGMGATTDDQLRARLHDHGVEVGDMVLGTFSDLDQGVRDDVTALLADPMVGASMTVRGYVYDVTSGRLRGVNET
jgi:carbonic anhydrase